MPNVFAHLGVGAAVTRLVIPDADAKWIFLGCVIPDVPWILQRVVSTLGLALNPYDIRLYFVVQASLAGSLLLAATLAAISSAPRRVFTVLALNVLVHLLLDACQTKWGNGIHILAPISWQVWKRSSGFFSKSFMTIRANSFGVSGAFSRIGTAGSLACLIRVSMGLAPAKTSSPARI